MADKPANVRTVLVVDDFEEMRSTLRLWLEARGYRVVEADDGEKAIEVAHLERPDLIFMDIGMPERSGISSTYKILKDPELNKIPIVALSAYADTLYAEALKAGCVECLSKPINTEELDELLSNLL